MICTVGAGLALAIASVMLRLPLGVHYDESVMAAHNNETGMKAGTWMQSRVFVVGMPKVV